jgi:DNA-directed RNA polymerase specialized sigma24 family protein
MGTVDQIAHDDEKRTDLTRLLVRLDSDPAHAWEKYRSLRSRLVKFFGWNQFAFPEELADEVLDRVARKPANEEIRDVAEFVIGVARNVRLEGYKKNRREFHIEDWPGGEESLAEPRDREEEIVSGLDHQARLATLHQCLGNLKPADRALALDYYSAEEEKQKVHRQNLASAAGITMTALRVRANRLRDKLEECLKTGLEARRLTRAAGEGHVFPQPSDFKPLRNGS